MSTPGSIGALDLRHQAVQLLVDEAVGLGVVLAAHVADRPGVEVRSALFTCSCSSRMVASLTLYRP